MEMRVEQLSVHSGVAVDTIRYYQSKGLLEPPRREGRVAWYDGTHLERLERIRSLQTRGFTLATIVRLVEGELDAADEALIGELSGERRSGPPAPPTVPGKGKGSAPAPGSAGSASPRGSTHQTAETAVDNEHTRALKQETFTLGELAVETGVPLALMKAIEAEGLLIPERRGDQDLYTTDDVSASRAGLLLLEWGIPLSALLDVARRHHEATEGVAREAVAMFSAHVRAPLRSGKEPRGSGPGAPPGTDIGAASSGGSGHATQQEIEDLLLAYEQLLPAVTTLVGHHFTRALVKAALDHVEQVGSDEERRAIWDQADLGELPGDGERVTRSDDPAAAPLA